MLTNRQSAVLAFIAAYAAREGYSPSLREMAREFRITNEGVRRHLEALQRKGAITRKPYLARSIRVIDKVQPTTETEPVVEC